MYNTLEEAQARILELEEELAERTNERDTLSQHKEQLTQELNQSRTLNQRYFEKLSAQYSPPDDNPGQDEEPPTCEEFALTINI